MKKVALIFLAAALLMCAAQAQEEPGFVEAAGDGRDFTQSPEELITSAMEVYSWFVMWPLDVDETMPAGDGTVYALLDSRFASRESMDQLLAEYFSPEIQRQLWDWGPYTEIEGSLYAPLDGEWRAIDGRIEEVSYAQTLDTPSRREYTVTVRYTDDGDEYTPEKETLVYVQEPSGGVWQFTEFPFFW